MIKLVTVALVLISTSVQAGPFAEMSFSVRETHNQAEPQLVLSDDKTRAHWINYSPYDVQTKNPYGSVSVGYSWRLTDSLKASLAIRHESSVATSQDRGVNDLRLTIRWGD